MSLGIVVTVLDVTVVVVVVGVTDVAVVVVGVTVVLVVGVTVALLGVVEVVLMGVTFVLGVGVLGGLVAPTAAVAGGREAGLRQAGQGNLLGAGGDQVNQGGAGWVRGCP